MAGEGGEQGKAGGGAGGSGGGILSTSGLVTMDESTISGNDSARAGGGIEAVAAIKAIGENYVPPTAGLDEPGPECDLDYTANTGKARDVNYAMSNSFAFGGLNAVLVFGPPPA